MEVPQRNSVITEEDLKVIEAAHSSVVGKWEEYTQGIGPTYLVFRSIPRLIKEIREMKDKYENNTDK